jgi:hypothetical protein
MWFQVKVKDKLILLHFPEEVSFITILIWDATINCFLTYLIIAGEIRLCESAAYSSQWSFGADCAKN